MELTSHNINGRQIAEVISNEVIIKNTEDGLSLLGDVYYQGFDKVVLYAENITPDFFDLKTGIAGEILQKFINYRIELAIAGNFSGYKSKSLADLIFESNKGRQVNFVASLEEALSKL
ncbi:DUF4180 domain-containing protein [Mucilaginibacter limnophilus]|uniref:DUF4180 domain-containing protein n=1 Tax=Mucilaginibacter limnophilus TaxID=1932778 RepID=A0A3S2V266_9SPHI|nr:DUF4180 domain-containing protein [Mucilaginibacter limnophilus]RVU01280.1 DUF4180 domain-containing protein [Mucilaginibacter limnophilus]